MLSTIKAVESATLSKKIKVANSTVCIVLNNFLLNLEKSPRDFQILNAIFNNILLFSKLPVCTKNSKDIDELNLFALLYTNVPGQVWKYRVLPRFDCFAMQGWLPNQAERSDRLLSHFNC